MSEKETESPKPRPSGLSTFWAELRRRHVVRVAITYAVVAWLIIQIAASTFEGFGIPDWAFRFVVIMVILGFPIAVLLAWAFELTPEGIKTTKTAKVQHPDSHEDKSHVKKRHWFSLGMAAAIPTVIFGALAVYFYATRSDSSPPVSPDVSVGGSPHQVEDLDKSIAVLPLENLSPDPENAFFADGVQGDVITNLSKIKDILVIGRTSTQQYRDTVKTLQRIGEELRVRYLVEGSVRRSGNQVRIGVQLIDAQTGGNLWGDNYNRNLDDIFAIQAEVAKQIAGQLKAILLPEEIAEIERRPTENQQAYDYYLRASNYATTLRSEMGALYEKATELDPDFYLAWKGLADWRIINWNSISDRADDELYEKAHHAFEKFKQLAGDSPEVLETEQFFAYSVDDNVELAIELLLRARQQGIKSTDLGWRYLQLGQLNEAQLYLEEAVKIDPFNYATNIRLLLTYCHKGLWREAEVLIGRNIELFSGINRPHMVRFWGARLSYLKYLQTGNKELYQYESDVVLDSPDIRGNFLSRIKSRDLEAALSIIDAYASDVNSFSLTRGRVNSPSLFGWVIAPLDLVEALTYFELNNKQKWLQAAGLARTDLEKIVGGRHKVRPNDLAALAICHALEGDAQKAEATIPKIRALTENVNWQFRAQASCEMKIAVAYLILDNHEKAIDILENARMLKSPLFVARELDLWFIFDRLRGNPRFDALLK